MKNAALAFAAILLSSPAYAATDCTLKEFASLDIAFSSGTMTVPVKVAGIERKMILDLAIPDAGIRESVASALQLKPVNLPPHIVSVEFMGDVVTKQGALPDFQIGVLHGKDVKVLLFAGSRLAPDVAGVLGTGIFAKLDAEFDFKNAKLNLFSPDHCDGGGGVVYWADAWASFPYRLGDLRQTYLNAKLDGEAIKTSLTTDGSNSSMQLSTAKRLFNVTPESPGMTVVSRNTDGTPARYRYAFKQLLLGDVAVNNPAIDIYPDTGPRCNGTVRLGSDGNWNTCFGELDLYLGMSILQKLHLYFAVNGKTLYITAADAHK